MKKLYIENKELFNRLRDKQRARITDPGNKPWYCQTYGTKYKKLGIGDYALYAILRGKDWRHTSHLDDAGNALEAIKKMAQYKTRLQKQFEESPESIDILVQALEGVFAHANQS
jgi:hypothetical protein